MLRMQIFVPIGVCCLLFSSVAYSQTTNTAAVPAPQNSWMERHELICKLADAGVGDVVFLGDSITARWAAEPLFNKEYGKYKAQNFGIGGDRTENVLWRMQHGALSNIRPKVIVLLIGTNNLSANTVPEIAGGVEAILKEIKARSPQTKILLLGVFPRDQKPGTDLRKKVAELNQLLAGYADGQTIRFLDFGDKFLEADGTITRETMMDFVHPGTRGYQIWADNIRVPLAEMVNGTANSSSAP